MVMQLFKQMQQERMGPNRFTCVLVIKAYACLGALEEAGMFMNRSCNVVASLMSL
jgi:hypothetical protein